jgi:Fe(II)/alpha-ketoglutarate-dependent arginine beta-hydroxylase
MLSPAEGERLAAFLAAHARNPYAAPQDMEDFIAESILVTQALPARCLAALKRFRTHGNRDGALLIRGLPIHDGHLGPTPPHWSLEAQRKSSYETELCLLGCASTLGEAYSFLSQHGGNLIQNIVPVPGDSHEQVGTSSRVFLEWHVEDAFSELRADFLGLLCLRANPEAITSFASVRRVSIPEPHRSVLFEERFLIGVDGAHVTPGERCAWSPGAVLHGDRDDPLLRLDLVFMKPREGDAEAAAAFDTLAASLKREARALVLEPGDLLFLDNRRVIHARSPFTPRGDGTDRWLQRVILTTDLRKLSGVRRRGLRVLDVLA